MTEPPNKRQKTDKKNEKSKGYQYKSKKRHYLEVGQKGFLATCNFREKDCVRECYNILSQYANELYGPEPPKNDEKKDSDDSEKSDTTETETDISDDLQREIDAVNATSQPGRSRRFQTVDTGAKNCVFVKTNLENPVELGTKIVKDIAEKRVQKTKHLLRLTPIEVVCKASVDEISKAGAALFNKHFQGEGGNTFSVVFNKRYNNDMKRDQIIKVLADMVLEKNKNNKVDLSNPELSVIVEIIKGKCCLAVVEGYIKYRKYNLVELGTVRPAQAAEEETNAVVENNEESNADSNPENNENMDEETEETPATSKDDAKRKDTEEEEPDAEKKADAPGHSKLKELLERKRPADEPSAKKFKEGEDKDVNGDEPDEKSDPN